jgi:hypothetical protein
MLGGMGKSADHKRRKILIASRTVLACAFVAAAAGRARGQTPQNPPPEPARKTPAQELPDAPEISPKDEGAGPVQQIEDKTKQAAEMTQHAAEEELIKARNWEASWISGVFVGKHQELVTLTPREREEIYLRQTLITPGAYMKRMFAAGIDQARGVPSQWDDGFAGYAERFASREGQFITANTLAALGNAKLGYEVRYDRCKCKGLWPRTRHAIIRNFLTYDRGEQNLRPQWALYGGAFGGGLVSTTWKPSPKNAWANGGWAVLGQAGYGTLLNFVIEFSREINRKQGVK